MSNWPPHFAFHTAIAILAGGLAVISLATGKTRNFAKGEPNRILYRRRDSFRFLLTVIITLVVAAAFASLSVFDWISN